MWAATSVSSLGDWLGLFALTLFVQRLSGRPEFAVGGVLLFRVLPALLFAQIGGVLADRFDRRRLMITADLSRALLIASIPWIHNLWALFGVSAVMEMLSLMWTPNKDATIPNLVERDELMLANQLGLITTYGTFPIGGALVAAITTIGGALAGTFAILRDQPTALAFFVDAATFCFSAAMVATLPAHLMKAKRARTEFSIGHAFRDLAEGLRFVRSDRSLRALIGGAWIAFTGGAAVISLGPIFAASAVADEAATGRAWGSLIVAVGTGLVSGMIFAGALAKWVRRERIFPGGLVVAGISVILTASFRTTGPATIMTFFVGLGAGVTWVTIFTLLQERVTDRLRGRTFATLYTGIHLSLFLGLAGWPLLAGLLGNRSVTVGGIRIDLSGFRVCMWAGGVLSIIAGVLAARTMRTASFRGRVARLRGLEFSAQAVAGGARPGLFIVFEGVEGSGKTTQLKSLHHMLVEFGKEVVVVREPGGTPISERVRGLVLDPGAKEMDAKTEALLYAASRAQLVAQVIRPALEAGKVVLCDRFIDSSLAYQGLARGLGEEDVLRLNMWATDETVPDIVILLDLDPEAGLARTIGDPDRMEQEDIAFHRKVREAYAALAARYPSRFAVIDASIHPDAVRDEVAKVVYGLIEHEGTESTP
jgi:dTMP kinase